MGRKRSVVGRIRDHLEAMATGAKYLLFRPRMTLMYPDEVQELPPGYRGMIRFIREECISCGMCARICPADAIKMYEGDEKKYPGINYMRCVFCGFCVDICPSAALEFAPVHDVACYGLQEHIYRPDDFSRGPPSVRFKKKPEKVRAEIDERRGIVYEPT